MEVYLTSVETFNHLDLSTGRTVESCSSDQLFQQAAALSSLTKCLLEPVVMLIKRLTLACEVTFWIAVVAAISAPQISYAARLTQVAAPSVASVQPLPGSGKATALDHLAAHYETYVAFLHSSSNTSHQ